MRSMMMRRREVMHEFCTWAYKSPIWNSQYTIPNATTSTNMVGWLVGCYSQQLQQNFGVNSNAKSDIA